MASDARRKQTTEKDGSQTKRKKTARRAVGTASSAAPSRAAAKAKEGIPRCGLCGKTKNLTQTECCGNWICDDEHTYRLFSYARNSCYRNHDRNTLCAAHHAEGHPERWQDCAKCRKDYETEMHVWYGTNEFNFEVLENPPSFEPTLCSSCQRRIVLGEGGYSYFQGKYTCMKCCAKERGKVVD